MREANQLHADETGVECRDVSAASGVARFCAIRSYLTTTCQHGLNLMDSIKSAFAGQPLEFAPK